MSIRRGELVLLALFGGFANADADGPAAARAPRGAAFAFALPATLLEALEGGGGRALALGREFGFGPRAPALASPTLRPARAEELEGTRAAEEEADEEVDLALLFASAFEAETARRFEPADDAGAPLTVFFELVLVPDAAADADVDEDLGLGTLEPEMARSTCGGSGEPSALNSARSGCWPRPLLRAESDSAFRP